MGIASLFRGIRQKKSEKAAAGWPAYRLIVLDLARGSAVDEEAAGEVFAKLNKSEADVSADVVSMKRRIEAARHFEAGRAATGQAAAALARRDQLSAELAEHVGRIQPQIDAAYAEFQAASTAAELSQSAKRDLISSCFDPAIIAAENRIRGRLAELGADRARIVSELDVGERNNVANNLARVTAALKDVAREVERTRNLSTAHLATDKQTAMLNLQANLTEQAEKLRRELAEIDRQISGLHRDLENLDIRKLEV